MIYIGARCTIPADHPEGSVSDRPDVCEVCRALPVYAPIGYTWLCSRCIKPFVIGFYMGQAIESFRRDFR